MGKVVTSFRCRICQAEVFVKYGPRYVPIRERYCPQHIPLVSVNFCPIDAKCDNYRPLQCSMNGKEVAGKVNTRVAKELEKEYLTRLEELQEELAMKYVPRFVANDEPLSEEEREAIDDDVYGKDHSMYYEYGHLYYT